MVKKKSVRKRNHNKSSNSRKDQLLLENLVSLQKVLLNLSMKIENLAEQTSKLLILFEVSAKSFAEKQGLGISKEDKDFIEKLDKLMEQNKLIAKGLTMMDEKIKGNNPPMNPQNRLPQRF